MGMARVPPGGWDPCTRPDVPRAGAYGRRTTQPDHPHPTPRLPCACLIPRQGCTALSVSEHLTGGPERNKLVLRRA